MTTLTKWVTCEFIQFCTCTADVLLVKCLCVCGSCMQRTKRTFLRYFLRVVRNSGVKRQKVRMLKREIRKSIRNKSKRSTGDSSVVICCSSFLLHECYISIVFILCILETECIVGIITQVTISDEAFPFDYDDITQFNCCLHATTVKDNLNSITEKVDQEDYFAIVLSKLRQVCVVSQQKVSSYIEDISLKPHLFSMTFPTVIHYISSH